MRKKNLTWLFLLLMCLVLPQAGFAAQQPEATFAQANHYYNEAIYDSALMAYHDVLDSGFESAALYYNLGNTYFKLRDFPSAILYFEKARKLAPADEDILFNIALANNMIVDRIEPLPQMFYRIWWNQFYGLFDADTWAWISVFLFVATLALLLLYLVAGRLLWRKLGFFVGLLMLIVFIGSFGLASQKYYYTQEVNEAILFAPTITVKSAPSANSVDLFVLHEGTKVFLLDELDDWAKIRIANGSVGWLPRESMKGI